MIEYEFVVFTPTYLVLDESGDGGRRDSIESIAFHSLRHDWSEDICCS